MVTDTQETITAAPSDGMITRATAQLRQFICGLHGHDALLHFEHGRMSLQCSSCGYESPGWDLRADQPRPKTNIVESAPRVASMTLVRQRRVA